MKEKIRIYIVVANRLLRDALLHIFKSRTGIEMVGSAEQAQQALEGIASIRPQVVLGNGMLPRLDWAEFVSEARSLLPEARFVVFGMPDDATVFFHAIRMGVRAYLLSEASASDLEAAVRSAAHDEAACPPRLCLALFNFVARQRHVPNMQLHLQHGLTRREQLLLPLIAQGLTNKEIAVHFSLFGQTIKNHIHRILRKVGAEDRYSAARVLDSPVS